MSTTKRILVAIIIGGMLGYLFLIPSAFAQKPSPKVKFYNFSEQLIDGQRRKPSIIYFSTREKVKFKRLLSLKKSFLRSLFNTSRNPALK